MKNRYLVTVIRQAALALILSYWTVNAHAQAPGEVAVRAADQALVQSAVSAYERRDYSLALTLFKHASVSAPSCKVRLYLARSRVALGQFVTAAEDYRSVADSAEPGASGVDAQALASTARDELAQLRPRIPSIELALGDAEQRSRNLRLVLDGRLVAFGSPVLIDAGHHEIVASDADGEQSRIGFEVGEGEAKTIGMNWRSPVNRANHKAEQAASGSTARRNWGVVALSVGATGLGIGTVTGIAALSRYSSAEAHCPANKCTMGAPYPEDESAFKTLRTISVAGYIVGGAGIGTWLGLLFTTPKPSAERPKVSPWTPVVGMGSAGARYAF